MYLYSRIELHFVEIAEPFSQDFLLHFPNMFSRSKLPIPVVVKKVVLDFLNVPVGSKSLLRIRILLDLGLLCTGTGSIRTLGPYHPEQAPNPY
jgi:hypothetical protein